MLHPLVAVGTLIAIVLMLTLPRQKAIVPFLLAFFLVPLGQVVLLGGLHFPVVRILIVVGVARWATSGREALGGRFAGRFNSIDRAVVLWSISGLIVVSIQWMDLQALVKSVGDFLDTLGGYLVARFLIPDHNAIRRSVKVLAVVCLIHGACMINEHITRRDIFGYLGGVGIETEVRDGHVRAGGLLGTIQSGTFGGVLVPFFLWLLTADKKSRAVAYMGLAGATAMVIMSGSSTSAMTYGANVVGFSFWSLRKNLRFVRWTIVLVLAGLHLVMNGPVWSLIEHIDLTGGSSSYHRYMLIDTLIRHFGDWWLLGTRENGTWGWEMWDTCNQLVDVGVRGGIVTLALYILILKRSFGAIGIARKRVNGDRKQEWFLFCLGVMLFDNVVAQFGINYMVQLEMVLFPLLATISVATFEARKATLQGGLVHEDAELVPAKGWLASAWRAEQSDRWSPSRGEMSAL
jgi:hypothetical protein